MYRNRLIASLIFSLCLLSAIGHANPPWPFPWAQACNVNWKSMEGRYELSEKNLPVHAENVTITETEANGRHLLRVSRYSLEGQMTYDGYAAIEPGQKTVAILLNSIGRNEEPVLATIRLSYQPDHNQCAPDDVVPTISLAGTQYSNEYKLVRAP